MAFLQDKRLKFIERCARCGKAKNQHRAETLQCPQGKRTPTGYRKFGPEKFAAALSASNQKSAMS
jgi:hypothetical protein